jgi:hypothetical protein
MKQAERIETPRFHSSSKSGVLGDRQLHQIIADLPWNKLSEDNLDLDQAQKSSTAIITIWKK